MNRQERRKREREIEKDMKVLRRLPEKDLLKINEIINKVAKSKADEALNLIDRSFSAILVNRGMTFKEIEKIQDELAEYMKEDQEKIIELEKENVDMAKLQKEVREFIEGLIKSGKGRKEVVEETMFKFPKLSKTAANNAFGKIQEELEIEDAAAYILEDNKEIKKVVEKEEAKKIAKKVAKDLEKEIEKEDHIVEVGQMVEESKEEVKEEKTMSKLKVKRIELEGEFGSYIREGDKVTAGEITFNSLEELEEYKKKEIELFNRRMEEIKEVYKIG